MTKDEKNWKLAEWLEPIADAVQKRLNGVATRGKLWTAGAGWDVAPPLSEFKPAIDFYTSEEASALLLEKMQQPLLKKHADQWACCPEQYAGGSWDKFTWNSDRKTAVAEAALAWIAAEESK